MELRVLHYFLEVAECGSITAASERLHVTQPTLSRQLKDLEIEVGQQLFVRHSHSMSLTQEGAFLRQRAQRIVEMVDQTEREMNKMGEESIGDVYIGSAETAHMQELTRAVGAFKRAYPRSVVHFVSGGTDDLASRFDSGVLDLSRWGNTTACVCQRPSGGCSTHGRTTPLRSWTTSRRKTW